MKKIFFAMTFAGICAVGANAACDVTYSIGSKAQLDEFRDVVNGLNGKTKNTAACAVLTADIKYNGETKILNDNMSDVSNVPIDDNKWTPIKMFEGTFDGQGHKIVGLYYKVAEKTNDGESSSYYDAGFFKNIAGNAIVRNLRIEDSFFAADERAGGITADVKTGANVIFENVSFSGLISSVSSDSYCPAGVGKSYVNGHFGGLIGTVSSGALGLTLTNCYSEAHIAPSGQCEYSRISGGLVGSVQTNSATVNIKNCYYAGSIERVDTDGIGIFTKAYQDPIIAYNKGSGVTKEKIYCSSGENCTETSVSSNDYASEFATNIATQKSSTATTLNNAETGAKGVTFTYDSETKKLTATIDSSASATVFSLPQSVTVDEIVILRKFTPSVYSTIMLPFNVATASVGGAGEFANLTSISDDFKEVTGTRVSAVSAYKPYLLVTSAEKLTVAGPVTLEATPSGESIENQVGSSSWNFIGTLAKRRWEVSTGTNPSNLEELEEGRIYGFAGSDKEKTGYEIGSFVKAKNKVAIRPMRAYLKYTGSLPQAQGKPAELGASYAPAAEIASITNLPDSLKVVIVDAEEPSEDFEEGLTSIQTLKVPANIIKSDRWHDVVGRSMNKPKAQGAYLNNRTPVIVK